MSVRQDLFAYITGVIRDMSGICLSDEKQYLLESRLQPLARERGYQTVEEMLMVLKDRPDEALFHHIVQSMTTNETMFFRDIKPYERLTQIIMPQLMAHHPGKRHVRIWSAACSTGQEPYTISICLDEIQSQWPGCQYEIVATDLCENALEKARKGQYTQFEVQRGLPIQKLIQYFDQKEGNSWAVKEVLQRGIRFDVHNLLDRPDGLGMFDIIFCRNVLIYFDESIKKRVLDHIISVMKPPGYLVLGSAESVLSVTNDLVPLKEAPGIFTLRQQ